MCIWEASLFHLHSTASFLQSRGTLLEGEPLLLKIYIFNYFRTLSQTISDFLPDKFGRVVKTAFYVSRGTFWKKNFRSFFHQKNLTIQVEMTFQEIISIDTHSTSYLPPSAILKQFKVFSRKKHLFYQKKHNFRTFWEILLFQLHSTANLLRSDEKKHVQKREQIPFLAWRRF